MNNNGLKPWKPGESGNPAGRPISDKVKAIGFVQEIGSDMLKRALDDDEMKEIVVKKLNEYFRNNAVKAFKEIILPLLPRDMKLEGVLESKGPVNIIWRNGNGHPDPLGLLTKPEA